MSSTDNFYIKQEEPNKSCFLALREIIIAAHSEINETIKYGMPCFYFKNKSMCYLWKDKKSNEPYILFVEGKLIEHPKLEQGDRKRMKVLPTLADKDLELDIIVEVLQIAVQLYVSGKIKTK